MAGKVYDTVGPTEGHELFTCPECGAEHQVYAQHQSKYFNCSSCMTYWERDGYGGWSRRDEEWVIKYNSKSIQVGSEATFDKIKYKVIGIAQKRNVRWKYSWIEYTLFNPYHGYCTLSEANGHWNIFHEITNTPRYSDALLNSFRFKERKYRLYETYFCSIRWAVGEFRWNVYDDSVPRNREFISPPYTLALESTHEELKWVKGEYLSASTVTKAFGLQKRLPKGKGMAPAKPLPLPLDQSLVNISFFIFIGILLFIGTVLSNTGNAGKVLFDKSITHLGSDGFIGDSIHVDGGVMGYTSLEICLEMATNYGWADAVVVLQDTKDTRYYGKNMSAEYYSGSSGGESWQEGSRDGAVVISGLPQGNYRVMVYDVFLSKNNKARIRIKQGVLLWSNIFTILLIAAAIPLFLWAYVYVKESMRWSDSEYSL